jgi:hypothetical protein
MQAGRQAGEVLQRRILKVSEIKNPIGAQKELGLQSSAEQRHPAPRRLGLLNYLAFVAMQYFTQHTNTEMSSAEQEAKAARED